MKHARKLLALFLCLVLVTGMLPVSALGAGTKHRAVFTVDDVTAEPGDTVTFNVYITENMGIAAGKVTISCPGLTITSMKQGKWALDEEGYKVGTYSTIVEEGIYNWYAGEQRTDEGVYCIVTATVDGEPGTYNITVAAEDLAGLELDENGEEEVVSYKDGEYAPSQTCTATLTVEGDVPQPEPPEGAHRAVFTVDDVTAEPGDTVTFNVYITENMGIAAGKVTISCPGLTVTNIKQGKWALDEEGYKVGTGTYFQAADTYNWCAVEQRTDEGVYCTVTATVDGEPGMYDIELVAEDLAGLELDENGEEIVVSYKDGKWEYSQTYTSTLTITGEAESEGQCGDDVYWTLDSAGTLTISGTGAMWDFDLNPGTMPWEDDNDSITNIVIETGVTSIGKYAFWYCESVKTVTIPDSVTEIGKEAFCCCKSLESVTIPEGVTVISEYTFAWCYALKDINLPSTLTEIGKEAFIYCPITSITIPEGVTKIDSEAFAFCGSLESVTLPSTLREMGKNCFYSCRSLEHVELSGGLTIIGEWAFSNCIRLTELAIPASVKTIGTGAFYGCSSLENITLDASSPYFMMDDDGVLFSRDKKVIVLVPRTFVEYDIPVGVTTVGGGAFINCSLLEKVTIPDTVTEIADYAFTNCGKLNNVILPNGLESVGQYAFMSCSSINSIYIPASVTSIDRSAFYYCDSLTQIVVDQDNECYSNESNGSSKALFNRNRSVLIYVSAKVTGNFSVPNTVKTIEEDAFIDCNELQSVIIPEGVEEIGVRAFYSLDSLKYVSLPVSLKSFNVQPFDYCYALTDIYYAGTQEQWEALDFDGHHAYSYDITIHYNTVAGGQCGDDVYWTLDSAGTLTISGTGAMWDYSWNDTPWYNMRSEIVNAVFSDGVTRIGSKAFYNCSSLSSVTIPDSVTTIGYSAFRGCSQLSSVTLPDSVTTILDSAFSYCYSLAGINLPDSLTTIGYAAFWYCTSLESVDIPSSVTQIRYDSFGYCSSLSAINVDSHNLNYSSDNYGALYNKNKTELICVPKTLVEFDIPDSVTDIYGYAFSSCHSLSSVTIPDSVTDFGWNTFVYCTSLSSIAIPDGLTRIYSNLFYGCTSLSSITIPNSVTQIDGYAFCGCDSLTDVYFYGTEAQWNDMTISDGNDPLTNATIHFRTALAITAQPQSTSARLNKTAVVTVVAEGEDMTYQWYFKNPKSSKYSVSKFTGDTYSAKMTESNNGRQVYCVITDKYGSTVTSDIAVLTLDNSVRITVQPVDTSAKPGEVAKVKVVAEGDGLTYQWYFKNPGAADYTQSKYTTNTYSMKMSKSINGRQVYCVVTDQYGNSVTSNTVTMSLENGLSITAQPQSTSARLNKTAAVTVVAEGEGLTYQWYFKNPKSSKYSVSKFTGDTYSVKMTEANNGRQVFCVITDKYGSTVTSDIAVLTVDNAVKITVQPANTSAKSGEVAKVKVVAEGDGLSYQWYFKNPGAADYTKSKYTTNTYSMKMSKSINGRQVYCIVTDQYGNTVTSDVAVMSIS